MGKKKGEIASSKKQALAKEEAELDKLIKRYFKRQDRISFSSERRQDDYSKEVGGYKEQQEVEVRKIDTMEWFETKEEAENFGRLVGKIAVVIEESGCTYQEALRAMNVLKRNYEKKGNDLLNNVNIQEVAKYGGLLN